MSVGRGLLLLAALSAAGCAEAWRAEGGEAEITLFGELPWTDEETVTVELQVEGENLDDVQIRCGVLADGSYEVSAFTTWVEELKRVRVAVEVPRFAGTSSYGADADPSEAFGELTFRQGGAEGWASDGPDACVGWIDEATLEGAFTCEGIAGSVASATSDEGPIGFSLEYRCGRAEGGG